MYGLDIALFSCYNEDDGEYSRDFLACSGVVTAITAPFSLL